MATHSRILAWRIPMNLGAWKATVHRVTELDTTEKLSMLLLSRFSHVTQSVIF